MSHRMGIKARIFRRMQSIPFGWKRLAEMVRTVQPRDAISVCMCSIRNNEITENWNKPLIYTIPNFEMKIIKY